LRSATIARRADKLKEAHKTSKNAKALGSTKYLTVAAAAGRLGVSDQTVRNRLRSGPLRGRQDASGYWQVEAASVEEYRAAHPSAFADADLADSDVASRLEELGVKVDALLARDAATADLVASLQRERAALARERDHYRADAAAAKAAALDVNAAARGLDASVRPMLDVLERQRDALTQLLAPGSPEDLAP
jgi:hypothetical protein